MRHSKEIRWKCGQKNAVQLVLKQRLFDANLRHIMASAMWTKHRLSWILVHLVKKKRKKTANNDPGSNNRMSEEPTNTLQYHGNQNRLSFFVLQHSALIYHSSSVSISCLFLVLFRFLFSGSNNAMFSEMKSSEMQQYRCVHGV